MFKKGWTYRNLYFDLLIYVEGNSWRFIRNKMVGKEVELDFSLHKLVYVLVMSHMEALPIFKIRLKYIISASCSSYQILPLFSFIVQLLKSCPQCHMQVFTSLFSWLLSNFTLHHGDETDVANFPLVKSYGQLSTHLSWTEGHFQHLCLFQNLPLLIVWCTIFWDIPGLSRGLLSLLGSSVTELYPGGRCAECPWDKIQILVPSLCQFKRRFVSYSFIWASYMLMTQMNISNSNRSPELYILRFNDPFAISLWVLL